MKAITNSSNQKGFTLIEAMIAALVLALGLVALARFQGGLIESSGDSKARTEAVNLAQDKIEELRNQVLEADYDALGGDSDNPPGTFDFTRTWTVADAAIPPYKQIGVSVSWSDRQGETQATNLNALVAWSDPASAATALVFNDPDAVTPLPSPRGNAVVGSPDGHTYDPTAMPDGAVDNEDGTHTYDHPEDEITEIIDSTTGEVLLTIFDVNAKVTITGKVYFDTVDYPYADIPLYHILASDAGYCAVWNQTEGSPYHSANYRCYVSNGWYGNIGVVITTADNQRKHCVGDPTTIPQLSAIRGYRGYDEATGKSSGIADQASFDALPGNHRFLVTRISGTVTDADCVEPMSRSGSTEFTDNNGKFVCLTNNCPIVIYGSMIHDFGNNNGQIASITTTSETAITCEVIELTGYRCETMAPWHGTITINAQRKETGNKPWKDVTCPGSPAVEDDPLTTDVDESSPAIPPEDEFSLAAGEEATKDVFHNFDVSEATTSCYVP